MVEEIKKNGATAAKVLISDKDRNGIVLGCPNTVPDCWCSSMRSWHPDLKVFYEVPTSLDQILKPPCLCYAWISVFKGVPGRIVR